MTGGCHPERVNRDSLIAVSRRFPEEREVRRIAAPSHARSPPQVFLAASGARAHRLPHAPRILLGCAIHQIIHDAALRLHRLTKISPHSKDFRVGTVLALAKDREPACRLGLPAIHCRTRIRANGCDDTSVARGSASHGRCGRSIMSLATRKFSGGSASIATRRRSHHQSGIWRRARNEQPQH